MREHARLVAQVRFRKLGDKPPQHRPAHQPQPRARIGAWLVLALLLVPVQVLVVLVLVLVLLLLLPLLPLLLALQLQLLPPLLLLLLLLLLLQLLLQLPPPWRLSQPPRLLQRGGIGKFSIGSPTTFMSEAQCRWSAADRPEARTYPPLDHRHRRSCDRPRRGRISV